MLERLNSVLEPQKLLVLVEKSSSDIDVEEIIAKEKFQFFATMNPGGDYGKRELSPALRNRFTEIWAEQVTSTKDIIKIIEKFLFNSIYTY